MKKITHTIALRCWRRRCGGLCQPRNPLASWTS
jgi:hypothetical protein